jgi:hypothetical protein
MDRVRRRRQALMAIAKLIDKKAVGERGPLNFLIGWAENNCPWRLPLYRAALAGELVICTPAHDQILPDLAKIPLPVIVLISERKRIPVGPTGWPEAAQILAQAGGDAQVTAGGKESGQDYTLAVERVQNTGLFVIIETTDDYLDAWWSLVRSVQSRCS